MNMMYDDIEKIIYQKPNNFLDFTQYSFLKGIDKLKLLQETVLEPLKRQIDGRITTIKSIEIEKQNYYFITKYLKWDSDYFGFPCYNLEMILSESEDIVSLNDAIIVYLSEFANSNSYVTFNIPSSQVAVIQALGSTAFKLIETRLNYSLELKNSQSKLNNPVRKATIEDIPVLRDVAKKMRNKFDRIHADNSFTEVEADDYLGMFAEQAVKGFADIVLVPNLVDHPPFAFLAGNLPIDMQGEKVSKLVLAASDSSVQKGWLYPLLLELINIVKADGANFLTTITQAANKPAIKIWEKAGFHLYNITHVYSYKANDKIS